MNNNNFVLQHLANCSESIQRQAAFPNSKLFIKIGYQSNSKAIYSVYANQNGTFDYLGIEFE